jgi:hypothetical protein
LILAVLAAAASAVGCGNPAGPGSGCGGTLSFTTLPVPLGAIVNVSPLGNLNPPSHTVPTDHAYFYLNGTGIALSAPGAFRITAVRTTHYLASTFRTGQSDYSVHGTLCEGYQLALAHIQTVVSKIQSQTGGNCQTYSTADETVQSCENDGANIEIAAGETIGTGVWVLQSNPVNQAGDQTPFIVLAPHLGYPQSSQSFSIGPPTLASNAAAGLTRFPAAASGRVNRRFREVTPDNQIYCYTADLAASPITYFVRLSGTVLTLQKVTHAPGASPCAADPASWALDGTALNFIR